MEIQKALDQISEIHGHLAKTDVYRGYKAVPVGLSGVLAIVAAVLQTRVGAASTPAAFAYYWVAVAGAAIALAGAGIVYGYIREESGPARRRTRVVVGQLLPCMAAGVLVTAVLLRFERGIGLLPGLWAILFSLGMFASRPYLPRITGWVALYYLASGAALLGLCMRGLSLSPWGMGVTFGFGQVLAGTVLYWDLERSYDR